MTAGDTSGASPLLDFLRGQLGGPVAEQVGRAAGYTGNTASRAVQGAIPVLLNAFANKASTEGGAAELLARSRDLSGLTSPDGHLNTAALGDPAEVARLEGQGRTLLGSLFTDVGAVTGRFGSAVGGPGASAGRVLALTAPLVLALVGDRARAEGLSPAGLGTLLEKARPLLPALIPAGLTGLGALLTGPVVVETVAAAVPQIVDAPPPPPAQPVAPAPAVVTTTGRRVRGGFPWWLIPLLLLLLLGGCWLVNQNNQGTSTATDPAATGAATGTAQNGAPVATPAATTFTITAPEAGAEVPATGFNMQGTGPAGETYNLFRGDAEVGTINVGEDGTWNVDVVGEATELGEQTYVVRTPGGTEVATLPVTAVAPAGAAGATPGAAQAGTADVVITQPEAGAEVPATGFNMQGTGPAGETYTLFRGDAEVGTINVGEDGTWNVDVVGEATELGEQTYAVRTPDGTEVARLPVTAVAPEEAAGATPPAGAGTTPGGTQGGAGTGDLTITAPQPGAEVPASGFSLRGTGPAGETYTLERNGEEVGTIDVGEDGTWTADVAPEATDVGEQTYVVRTPDGTEAARLPVTGVPTTGGVDAAANPDLPQVTVTDPARGAEVPATGFDISGTGPAGATLELIEDEVGGTDDSTLGSFTVGEDGTWTANVPSSSAGDKVYVIRTPNGAEVAALPLTVVPAAAAAANCTTALALNPDEGERVSAPFRLGGVGNAEGYTVTVRRGDRVVGTRQVRLTPECTWSYVSDPGGREDAESQVTYEVRPSDAASTSPASAQVTVTVSGSGTNFNAAGEYVGPLGSN